MEAPPSVKRSADSLIADADAPPPLESVTRGMGGKVQFNLNGMNHPFRIQPVFDKKRTDELAAAGTQTLGPFTESFKRCLAVDPSLLDDLQRGQVEVMHTDLFFSRPVDGYFSSLQAWSDRRTDTPQARLMFAVDDFLMRAFYNPRIGSHGSIVGDHSGSFTFTSKSKDKNDPNRIVTLPKQRIDVEVLLRDPYIRDPGERFAPTNVIGIRDRRSFIDDLDTPGLHILAQIWDNQYAANLIDFDEMVQREYLIYQLTHLDIHRVIDEVSKRPEMAHHRTSLVELVKKAKSELKDIKEDHEYRIAVEKARDDNKGDRGATQQAINEIVKEAKE